MRPRRLGAPPVEAVIAAAPDDWVPPLLQPFLSFFYLFKEGDVQGRSRGFGASILPVAVLVAVIGCGLVGIRWPDALHCR